MSRERRRGRLPRGPPTRRGSVAAESTAHRGAQSPLPAGRSLLAWRPPGEGGVMDVTTSRVGVVAGPGLVGRFGEAVLLVAGDDGAPGGDLLDLVETAAAESARPGAVIAGRLAGWLGTHAPAEV